MPPDHTLIIEANISSSVSKRFRHKFDKHLKNCILTSCGDADVMSGTKHINPVLCLYIGASLICIDIKHMKDRVPRGNGTLCKVLGVKLRENAPSHTVKNYHGKKVWKVNAKHVEWVQCEHVNIPRHIVQLKTQINELEKEQQYNKNKTKLEELKERLINKKMDIQP